MALGETDLNREAPLLHPRPRRVDLSGRIVSYSVPHESIGARLPAQGYRLSVTDDRTSIEAADGAGLRYGRITLDQLRSQSGVGSVRECEVVDWPDFETRGVMIDVSRDKVPTVATLETMITRLAAWKVNHVELYMEHTFAYAGHDDVWREADPLTAPELTALDRFCRELGVDLVPNQNTLGHFDRWLRHERYKPLAVAPDGFEWLFGIRRSPTTIDPRNPDSFVLVTDLLDQLVEALDKPALHIGLDEPWELTGDRVADWPGWLRRLSGLGALDGRRLLVWGDVPAAHPEMLGEIATADWAGAERLTICEWGYEADHPYDERLSVLGEAGLDFWVCPGTSAWMSITGRGPDMLENVRNAAVNGEKHGASGLLVTDWGDFGHHQYLPVSEPGLAAAAAFGWCVSSHEDLDLEQLARVLDLHAFDDESGSMGHALVALSSVHKLITPQPPNMSPLIGLILFPQLPVGRLMTRGMTIDELAAVESALDDASSRLANSTSARPDAGLVLEELSTAANWLRLACRDAAARLAGDGYLRSVPPHERSELEGMCRALRETHERLWLARNRPGGLKESSAWLDHMIDCYSTGRADRDWFGPLG